MKIFKNLLSLAILSIFLCPLFISCEPVPSDDTIGNWVGSWADFRGIKRCEAVAFSIGNTGYVGTGYSFSSNYTEKVLGDFYSYDPTLDTWTQIAGLPDSARRYSSVAFTIGKKAYVGLGWDGENYKGDFYVYDSENNSWSLLSPVITEGHEGPSARKGAVAFTIDNLGYVGTGYDGNDLQDVWSYNPVTNTWTEIPIFHSKVTDAVAFVIDGKGYVTTGYHNTYNADLYAYDPKLGKWEEKHAIENKDDVTYDDNYAIKRRQAVAFTSSGKGYVTSGYYSGLKQDIWEYNPKTDRWIEKTSFEGSAREDAVSFTLENGRTFITTGQSGSECFDDFWEFEPMDDYDSND
jgi:N-acetylneuraminic acid mutarotase